MTRALPRSNFNSSRLIRILADLAVVDEPDAGHDFAEKLALWLDFTDAITLSTALNAHRPLQPGGRHTVASATLTQEFARTQASLVNAITKSFMPNGGGTRLKLPTPALHASVEIAAAYEPYRRFYLAQQREIEQYVRPLRSQVRQVLATTSPALARLSLLDAAMGKALDVREGKLLATVPARLEKRFKQLLRAHRQMLADRAMDDDPAQWGLPGSWLGGFCRDMQAVLLAEVDLRMQPIMGMIEALGNDIG